MEEGVREVLMAGQMVEVELMVARAVQEVEAKVPVM